MFELLTHLDTEVQKTEASWSPGDETGNFFRYEIIDDSTVQVDYGYSGYEECDNNEITVGVDDIITVNKNSYGYSIDGGSYEHTETLHFNTIHELIQWLCV